MSTYDEGVGNNHVWERYNEILLIGFSKGLRQSSIESIFQSQDISLWPQETSLVKTGWICVTQTAVQVKGNMTSSVQFTGMWEI